MKKKYFLLTLIMVCIFLTMPVYAANPYCRGLKSTFRIVGEIVRVIKIVIPLFIVLYGMLDLFKVVTKGNSESLGKSLKSLLLRFVAGILIFFLPAFIEFAFNWFDEWTNYENDYNECISCVLDVKNCK